MFSMILGERPWKNLKNLSAKLCTILWWAKRDWSFQSTSSKEEM